MINLVVFLLIAVFLMGTALLFRHAIKRSEYPTASVEFPQSDAQFKFLSRTFSRWKDEGKLTREDHERLLAICREENKNHPYIQESLSGS